MKNATEVLHAIPADPLTGAISVPIYQTATFVQEAPGVHKGFDYARSNNPTRKVLEELIAELENVDRGFAFASGLAAIDAVLKLLHSGDEILAVDDIYGGSFRLFEKVYDHFGIRVKYVDTADLYAVQHAIGYHTKYIWVESPTNPTLKVSDIAALADIAHAHNALLVVDNTFASPIAQQPHSLGADIVLHSATKYLAGHSDLIAGLVTVADPALSDALYFIQNASGGILAPFDAWLTIRGIETLHLRLKKQSENALAVAQFLQLHPAVRSVHYPGLPEHPNHAIAKKQQKYFGGVLSFDLKIDESILAEKVCAHTRLFKCAESLGGVKSLLCHPAGMTHKSVPQEKRHASGISDSLIRLSCGIEETDDLLRDIDLAITYAISAINVQTV
ncbi:MAG: PLP-dependent aspartate aminotransferase family protein [Chitinophagales bacterium]